MSRLTFSLALTATTLLAIVQPAEAHKASIRAEERTSAFDAQVKACDDATVLGDIRDRFDAREANDWKTGLQLVSIDHVRTGSFRPNGKDLIPRRFCSARAHLSNGKSYALTYNLSEDGGFAGWHGSLFLGAVTFPTPGSYHLEWCIEGLDRHRTFAPACVMARP